MFLFAWRRSGRPTDPAGSGVDDSRTLLFDPARVAAGIAFHLIDQGLAAAVDPGSREAVARELDGRCFRLVIGRARWIAMSNPQRLRWLLEQSKTGISLRADRTAVLMPIGCEHKVGQVPEGLAQSQTA